MRPFISHSLLSFLLLSSTCIIETESLLNWPAAVANNLGKSFQPNSVPTVDGFDQTEKIPDTAYPSLSTATTTIQTEFIRQLIRIDERLGRDPDMQIALNSNENNINSDDSFIPDLISRPTLDPIREKELRFYSALTAAAYCRRQSIFPNWQCGHPRCQSAKSADSDDLLSAMQVHRYLSQDGIAGYVARNRLMPEQVFIIYRGTLSVENFVNDLMFAQADYSFPEVPPLARVHEGFYRTWLSIREQTLTAVQSLLHDMQQANTTASSPRPMQIILAGHSLGGACAVLAGLELRRRLRARQYPFANRSSSNSVRFRLYTYGEPRLGNTIFAKWLAAQAAAGDFEIHRTTYFDDLVPRLPPRRVPRVLPHLQFHHHSAEFHILRNRSSTIVCQDGQPIISAGEARFQSATTEGAGHIGDYREDPLCSSGVKHYNIFSHLTYYDIIYGPWC